MSYLGEVIQLIQIGNMGTSPMCFNVKNASAIRCKNHLPSDVLLTVNSIAEVGRTPASIMVPSSHPKLGLI